MLKEQLSAIWMNIGKFSMINNLLIYVTILVYRANIIWKIVLIYALRDRKLRPSSGRIAAMKDVV